jgi:hypothetical protein
MRSWSSGARPLPKLMATYITSSLAYSRVDNQLFQCICALQALLPLLDKQQGSRPEDNRHGVCCAAVCAEHFHSRHH